MLNLTRRIGESIIIANNIRVTFVRMDGQKRLHIAVDAPRDVPVHREEIQRRIDAAAGGEHD